MSLCCAPGCWARNAADFGGVPLCPPHADAVKAVLAPAVPEPPQPLVREPDPFVYYVTRADKPGLVKIGTTTNLRERMRALAWRAGPVTLLATEPGGRALESRRHKQFAGLRQAGEWFTLAEELHRHIHRLSDLQPSVT